MINLCSKSCLVANWLNKCRSEQQTPDPSFLPQTAYSHQGAFLVGGFEHSKNASEAAACIDEQNPE